MKAKRGCYYVLFGKQNAKRLAQCHAFAQSPPRQRASDKYPVSISQRSRFV
jgi:hypothetical protein